MNKYYILDTAIDSIDLKCLVVSQGVKVSKEVYRNYSKTHRLGVNPLMCNSIILSDGTIIQLTDMGFHLRYLTGILSWDNLKLLRYASDLETPFSLKISEGKPALFYNDIFLDFVSFPPKLISMVKNIFRTTVYRKCRIAGCGLGSLSMFMAL